MKKIVLLAFSSIFIVIGVLGITLTKSSQGQNSKAVKVSIPKDARKLNMIEVEGGTFEMGKIVIMTENPHQETVETFLIGDIEVTQVLYTKIMGDNPSSEKDNDFPVNNVSWFDAIEFCNKLSEAEGFMPCYTLDQDNTVQCDYDANGYRLPTEAEWEYAARAGKFNSPYKYSGSNNFNEVAVDEEQSAIYNQLDGKHKVAIKKPNELGIYDMTGNVAEMCGTPFFDLKNFSREYDRFKVVKGGNSSYDKKTIIQRDRSDMSISSVGKGIRLARTVR